MPVHKYRSVEDMPPPPRTTGDDLVERIRAVWNRAVLLCPLCPPRGVMRFRTIEEANAARERATLQRMARTAARR